MKLMSRGRRVNVFWKRTYVLVFCLKKSPKRANQNLKTGLFSTTRFLLMRFRSSPDQFQMRIRLKTLEP